MKVKMYPNPKGQRGVTGIEQVVMAYGKYLPDYGIEIVPEDAKNFDLIAGHAGHGMSKDHPYCLHSHGLHWTADYPCHRWQYSVNKTVIEAARQANIITVPSSWVAESFQRDMRISPVVVPHGIDWDEWQGGPEYRQGSYVLYNKNREGDVCDSSPLSDLAQLCPDVRYLATFAKADLPNIRTIGVVPHSDMKHAIQMSSVYLATTKETFGIGILEAMASGIPVLGYAHGGILDLIEHGVNGYLAEPGDVADLARGLRYCQEHGLLLGNNGREMAQDWTWEKAVGIVASSYRAALETQDSTVAVIIPTFNYAHVLGEAVASVLAQDSENIVDIIVVDDGSNDDPLTALQQFNDSRIQLIQQNNAGVANARNRGIEATDAKYIVCLDADDMIKPTFVSSLVPALEKDRGLGIAYSSLMLLHKNGKETKGDFPGDFNADGQTSGMNQIPTCCMFRRDAWERVGGYRQRYAPDGCGAEDAEFWLRITAMGYDSKRVTRKPLFVYRLGGYTNSTRGYKEVDYTRWHPWTKHKQHPFASLATPEDFSHPVRQYDIPIVSVVIPVGPAHTKCVIEALDSVEAQTMHKWEVIVAWDSRNSDELMDLQQAYPFIRVASVSNGKGAGYARNRGAEIARAPFLLFLDADDWLEPDALEEFLLTYGEQDYESIVYAESYGYRAVDEATAQGYDMRNELISYKNGLALVRQPIDNYRHDAAVGQPYTPKPYFWCYVTSLIPTAWHHEIGGFDEDVPAWEDWDYWIRLAKAGKPFVPCHKPLMTYRYDSGTRREEGQQIKTELMDYLKEKHKGVKVEMCRHCNKGKRSNQRPSRQAVPQQRSVTNVNDDQFTLCRYTRNKTGSHPLTGTTVFSTQIQGIPMRRTRNGWVVDYGYRSKDEVFLVHVQDRAAQAQWFTPVETQRPQRVVKLPEPAARVTPVAPRALGDPEPEPIPMAKPTEGNGKGFDLQSLSGVTPKMAVGLVEAGLTDLNLIKQAGLTGLQSVKGIGERKATQILEAIVEREVATPPDFVKELEDMFGKEVAQGV